MQAETKLDAEKAFDLFIVTDDTKYPKATLCLPKDREELLAFYIFPGKLWQSIRTSKSIESSFGIIRHHIKRQKGYLPQDGIIPMMFKPGMPAQENWQHLHRFKHLAQAITGVKFEDGIEVKQLIRPRPNSDTETPQLTIMLSFDQQHLLSDSPTICEKWHFHRKVTSTSITIPLTIPASSSHGKFTTRSTAKIWLSR